MTTVAPNLQLPQRPVSSAGRGGVGAVLYLLVLALLALQAGSLWMTTKALRGDTPKPPPVEAETEKQVAIMLEDRNLPLPAVASWERYLNRVKLTPAEEAPIRYRMGKLLQQAEKPGEAVAEFYWADRLLGDEGGDLKRQVTLHVRECLEKLGKFSDLSREMAARSDMTQKDASPLGQQVVAEIGDEKITVADFDRMLTEQVEQSIAMRVGISEQEAENFRKQAHSQFADPMAKAEQLQQLIASRVLAGEAREQGLQDSSAFRRQMADFTDQLLATRLMLDEVAKRGTVTPQDVERYFEANEKKYAVPAEASIAHILCDSEESAREVIGVVQTGDFAATAKERSRDEKTRDKGGAIAQAVTESGDYVPVIGVNADLHKAIFAAEKGTVLTDPYKSDAGWHVVKVTDRKEGHDQAFDDVRETVQKDVAAARRSEVSQQYIHELFDSKKVKFYPNAFVAGAASAESGTKKSGS